MKYWPTGILLGRRLCSSLAFSTTTTGRATQLSFLYPTATSSTTKVMAASLSTSHLQPKDDDDRPTLKGVVFDMDGTLTNSPSLDFAKMYARCNVPHDQDILKAILSMPPSDAASAQRIVDEMEEEGRQTMYLIPGATQVAAWLHYHSIPMALVTRNTDKTVNVMLEKHWNPATESAVPKNKETSPSFDIILSRDNNQDIPPKPHPASLEYIASKWSIDLPSKDILMVGDNLKHDVGFGKAAGVSTAFFDFHRVCNNEEEIDDDVAPDLHVNEIYDLPALLCKHYSIDGPLGTNVPRGTLKYSTPEPKTIAGQASVQGDIAKLSTLTQEELVAQDENHLGGNTPLIWAVDAGQLEVVDYLLQNVGEENLKDYVNARGYLGATAFCRACQRGNVDAMQRLLTLKTTDDSMVADINIPNDKMQYPLHFAAFKRHREAVSVLLENGADTLVLDRKGRTPAEDTADEVIRDAILSERRKRISG